MYKRQEQTRALPWENYIPKDGKFWVAKANSIKSKVFSPSDIQSVMKKAIVERLKEHYRVEWFPEDGASYPIRVSFLKDQAVIGLDTTGVSLHKRGYRQLTAKAPITETLAAALLMLTPWKGERILVDPFCGSGTFVIEAAMMAAGIAPGMNRTFLACLLYTSGCALPYYVGGEVESRDQLIVNTPEKYAALTGVRVLTGREAFSLDAKGKKVQVKNLEDGSSESYGYDALVIATGASSIVPKMNGAALKGVFKLRMPDDAIDMRRYLQESGAGKAVVVGGGFIGLETAENLKAQGLQVTVLDAAPQIIPGVLDPEMAVYAKRHLQKKGIRVFTGVMVEELLGDSRVTAVKSSAGTFPADLVVMSIGIRPNTACLLYTSRCV